MNSMIILAEHRISDYDPLFDYYREEKYLEKQNNNERHEKREATIFYNPERKRKIEERQKQYYGLIQPLNGSTSAFDGSNDINFDPNTPEHSKMSKCQLKGPFHPLEFRLTSAHKVGGQRIVNVDPESVNSVLLDDHPEDTINQFLVAAHVGRILFDDIFYIPSNSFIMRV